MHFSLEAISLKETVQLLFYVLILLILWRFSTRRVENRLLRAIVFFFVGESLDQSSDVLIALVRQYGSPPGFLTAWHIYTRLVFLGWLYGISMLLWSMLGDRFKMAARNWLKNSN